MDNPNTIDNPRIVFFPTNQGTHSTDICQDDVSTNKHSSFNTFSFLSFALTIFNAIRYHFYINLDETIFYTFNLLDLFISANKFTFFIHFSVVVNNINNRNNNNNDNNNDNNNNQFSTMEANTSIEQKVSRRRRSREYTRTQSDQPRNRNATTNSSTSSFHQIRYVCKYWNETCYFRINIQRKNQNKMHVN